jgi:teichuronic acid biosynthesis glycosyltransferase TuaC
MRILFVSSGKFKEGISPLVFNQGESLKKQSISIEYFTINSRGFIGYFLHIFKLRKYLKRNYYDIVHAHYGLSGLVAVFAKQKKNKLIISFMGTDLLGYQTRKGQTTIIGNLLVRINQRLSEHSDYIIVKSNEMAGKISCKNKSIIPNGVDLTNFYPMDKSLARQKLGWNNEIKHIFFMGDPKRPEKNYNLARTAVKKLIHQGIELNLMQDINPSEVLYYYNASDICLLTSFHEGSPNVIKEAMACNCIIISTNVGDVSDIFRDTKGCYISSFSHDELSIKIKEILTGSQEKEYATGRNRIIELGLDSETVAKKIIRLYEQVLSR